MEHTPTHIIADKIGRVLLRTSLRRMISAVSFSFLAGILLAGVLDTSGTVRFLLALLSWKSFAITKTISVLALTLNAKRIRSFIRSRRQTGATIEGIPTVELLDHLFSIGTFKRDEAEKKFGIPRYRVIELTKNLKRVGILSTGINNQSILNPEFSRQDVASILDGKMTARDLSPLFRKDSAICYTSEPSAAKIRERVRSSLSPLSRAHGFTTRTIATASGAAAVRAMCEPCAAA